MQPLEYLYFVREAHKVTSQLFCVLLGLGVEQALDHYDRGLARSLFLQGGGIAVKLVDLNYRNSSRLLFNSFLLQLLFLFLLLLLIQVRIKELVNYRVECVWIQAPQVVADHNVKGGAPMRLPNLLDHLINIFSRTDPLDKNR